MIINRNHQTAAAVNLIVSLYQIGTFGINFDYHVRCLNLESLSTGNVDVSSVPCTPTVSSNSSSNDSSFLRQHRCVSGASWHRSWIIPAVPVLPWPVRSFRLSYRGYCGPLRSYCLRRGCRLRLPGRLSSGRLQSVVLCFQGHVLRNMAVTLPVSSYNKEHYVHRLHDPGRPGIRILWPEPLRTSRGCGLRCYLSVHCM